MDANQVLGSSKETENYQCLARLLISGGTCILRQLFDTKFIPPHDLSRFLAASKPFLVSARFITTAEREKLFPSSGNPAKSSNFDITLLIKLFRNMLHLPEPGNGWDHLPNRPEDQSIGDDLARIKYYRNEVHGHATSVEVSDGEFQMLWREISQALLRIVKIVNPGLEERWKAAMEFLRTAPAHFNEEINFEDLFKMEIEEMRHSLSDLCLSTEKNTDSVRETKDAVEQVHDTLLQALTSSSSAQHGSNVVYQNVNVFNINNATHSTGRQDRSFPVLTALGSPESPPLAHSYRNPSTANTAGSLVSSNGKYRPRPWHESDVDTALEHQHFPDGTHAARDTRYQRDRRLQRPYSEPYDRDTYLDTSDQVPQFSSDTAPKRSAQERPRMLHRPFSDSHVYDNYNTLQEHQDSAQDGQQVPFTADHLEESCSWSPKNNSYTVGAYGPGGSSFHLPDQSFCTPVRDQPRVERTHVADSRFDGGRFRHPPETRDEPWSHPPDKDFRNPSFDSNGRHQRSPNHPISSREPRAAVGDRDTEFAQTTPQKTGHIRMSIECQWIGNDVELSSFREDVNMAICHRITSQLPNPFRQCLEDKELVIEDVRMKDKICILNLHAQHQACLERLWEDYRSGNLDALANQHLISADLLQCYGASQIILKVTIDENYEGGYTEMSDQAFQQTCEPGLRSQSFSESGGTPSVSGMSRAKSMGNLTSLFGPEGDGTASKRAARELFQSICRRGCTLSLTEAIQSLSHSSRDVIENSPESPDRFVRKFPDLFSLYRSEHGCFILNAVLAVRFCKINGCSACPDLHVCPFNLLGTCAYNPRECRQSHDVNDTHTQRVLRGLDLGDLSSYEKMVILAKIAKDKEPEWRKPVSEIPQVCRFYNMETRCTRDDCNRLHVCRFWIKDKCKYAQCKRNHTYQSKREQEILGQCDMARYPDCKISEIISPNINVE